MDEKNKKPQNNEEKETWEMSPEELLEAQLSGKVSINSKVLNDNRKENYIKLQE